MEFDVDHSSSLSDEEKSDSESVCNVSNDNFASSHLSNNDLTILFNFVRYNWNVTSDRKEC